MFKGINTGKSFWKKYNYKNAYPKVRRCDN